MKKILIAMLLVLSAQAHAGTFRSHFTIEVGRLSGVTKNHILKAANACQVQAKIEEQSSFLSKTYYVEFVGNEEQLDCFEAWYKRITDYDKL